jgi:hypothetical protein
LVGAAAFATAPAGPHAGKVNAIAVTERGDILSVGDDGYLNRWDGDASACADRFQLSQYAVEAIACRPGTPEIAVLESDGLGLFRISAWNYLEKRKLFTLRFKDSVSFLRYSASGSFILVGRSAQTGVALIEAATGEVRPPPPSLTGPVSFAATGKSEKTMVVYSSFGELGYWDLSSGQQVKSVPAPVGLRDCVLLSNNLCLAARDGLSFVLIDSLTGAVLYRQTLVDPASSVFLAGIGDFAYLIEFSRDAATLTEVSAKTREAASYFRFSNPFLVGAAVQDDVSAAAVVLGGDWLVSLADGRLARFDQLFGTLKTFAVRAASPLLDVAAASGGGDALAAVAPRGVLALPSEPSGFAAGAVLSGLGAPGATRLALWSAGRFLTWNPDDRNVPVVRRDGETETAFALAGTETLRTVAANERQIMGLDLRGNLETIDVAGAGTAFRYSALGLTDGLLLADGRILLGKSAATAPYAPLVVINQASGETVPVPLPGKAVGRVFNGAGDDFYCLLAASDASGDLTCLVRVDANDLRSFRTLAQYRGEDLGASVAVLAGRVATTLGGDGAAIFADGVATPFQRAAALPRKLVATGSAFVALNQDGSLSWFDPANGKLEATLRVYDAEWELTTADGVIGGVIEWD